MKLFIFTVVLATLAVCAHAQSDEGGDRGRGDQGRRRGRGRGDRGRGRGENVRM